MRPPQLNAVVAEGARIDGTAKVAHHVVGARCANASPWGISPPATMSQGSHTMFAGQAIEASVLFNALMGKTRVGAPIAHTPRLSAPEGESTGGGKRALSHVTLVPEGGGRTLLAGHVNTVARKLELRSHSYVSSLHRQRFQGEPYPIENRAYNEFLAQVRKFFEDRKYDVTTVDAPAASAEASSDAATDDAPAARSPGVKIVVVLAVALAVVAGFFLLRR